MHQKGFTPIILVIVILLVILIGGGLHFFNNNLLDKSFIKQNASKNFSNTNSSEPLPHIIYSTADTDNKTHILIYDPNLKTEKEVQTINYSAKLILSPDHKKIVYDYFDPTTKKYNLYLINITDGSQKLIFQDTSSFNGYDEDIGYFYWSNDSNSIVFWKYNYNRINDNYKLDINPGTTSPISFDDFLVACCVGEINKNIVSQPNFPAGFKHRPELETTYPFNNNKAFLYRFKDTLGRYDLEKQEDKIIFNSPVYDIKFISSDKALGIYQKDKKDIYNPNRTIILIDLSDDSTKEIADLGSGPSLAEVTSDGKYFLVKFENTYGSNNQILNNKPAHGVQLIDITGKVVAETPNKDNYKMIGFTNDNPTVSTNQTSINKLWDTTLSITGSFYAFNYKPISSIQIPSGWSKKIEKDGTISLYSPDYNPKISAQGWPGAIITINNPTYKNSLAQSYEAGFKELYDLHPGGAPNDVGLITVNIDGYKGLSSYDTFEGFTHSYAFWKGNNQINVSLSIGGDDEIKYYPALEQVIHEVLKL